MDPDPMQFLNEDDGTEETRNVAAAQKSRNELNTLVAITVALLATFMGICKVKDDNIVQAMQQAQANKIDSYSWYQARNIREDIARATIAQLTVQAKSAPTPGQVAIQEQIKVFEAIAQQEVEKKKVQQVDAEQADNTSVNQLP